MTIQDFIGTAKYDKDGQMLWGVSLKDGHQLIANIRGWGAIQNLFKSPQGEINFAEAEKFQDALGEFVASAINEKLQRESNNQP